MAYILQVLRYKLGFPVVGVTFASASLKGVWDMFPPKALNHFEHSQADSYVKKVLKIDRYFYLNFDKMSIVINSGHVEAKNTTLPRRTVPVWSCIAFNVCVVAEHLI